MGFYDDNLTVQMSSDDLQRIAAALFMLYEADSGNGIDTEARRTAGLVEKLERQTGISTGIPQLMLDN